MVQQEGVNDGFELDDGLFGEKALRKHLSCMYVAMIGSNENVRLMLESNPADIRSEQMGGSNEARSGMEDACAWMTDAEILCSDRKTFEDVILGVARRTARYVANARSASRRMPPLDCWIFQKSSPYEGTYGTRTTISMIVPEIESCMSVRPDTNMAEAISLGVYRFGSVLPIPLTNRLHPTTRKASPIGGSPSLGRWNFLKISFEDRLEFSNSLEMDNYCEIASVQSEGRHHLGAPLILPGRITAMDEFRITIGSIINDASATVMRARDCTHTNDELRQLKDVSARFLIVEWYQPAGRKASIKYPELLHVEAAEPEDLRNDDLIGYVRLRGQADLDHIRKRYGSVDPSVTGCLTLSGDSVVYASAATGSASPVIREFLATTREIRAVWSKYRTDDQLLVAASSIVSQDSSDMAQTVSRLKRHPFLADTLLDMQASFDRSGEGVFESESSWRGRKAHMRTLKRIGLLDTGENRRPITKKGIKIAAMIFKDEIEKALSDLDSVYIPELKERIPSSVMLAHLQSGKAFKMLKTQSGRNKLIWIRSGKDDGAAYKDLRAKLARHYGLILGCMRTINHPITSRFIHDELESRGEEINHHSIDMMMNQLGGTGKIIKSGSSWEYNMRWRIHDLVGSDQTGSWTLERVMSESRIGLRDRGAVLEVLQQLARDGVTVELSDGTWVWKSGPDQVQRHADGLVKEKILSILRSRKDGMGRDNLVGCVRRYTPEQFRDKPMGEKLRIIRKAIDELEKSNAIHALDGMYRITR